MKLETVASGIDMCLLISDHLSLDLQRHRLLLLTIARVLIPLLIHWEVSIEDFLEDSIISA